MSERIFFDAILEPNKPLGPRGLAMVVGFVALVSFCAGILFALRGAWPVTPFFGADVLLLAWAMRASVRASRKREHLVLTREKLLIERRSARGEVWREEINPYWLRVDHDDPELLGAELALVSRGRRWIVGSFLGAEERTNLAEALRRALRDARNFTPGV
ncbi:MAG TPA: DUF2244 domain-containing protein [Micropepsaceae bacterium]|jgi:uncharacterized membrane protein|nr:DUF2244 domain-containing protein [Micropepsaceae bacterium]